MDRSDKKELIADTYTRLLAEIPGGNITVTMLIRECGISRQTFYYHFRDIMDVVEYILRKGLSDILAAPEDSDDPAEAIRRLIREIDDNRELIRKLGETPRSREIQKCVTAVITEISEQVIENRTDLTGKHSISEMRFALSMYAHGFEGYILDRIERNEPLEADVLADLLYRFITGELSMLSF